MRPKFYQMEQQNKIFFLSPEKVLIVKINQGKDFPQAEKFNTEEVIMLSQIQPSEGACSIQTKDFKVKVE